MSNTILKGDLLLIKRHISNVKNDDVVSYIYPLDTGYLSKHKPLLIGRCVAKAGDHLKISNTKIVVNNKIIKDKPTKQYNYKVISSKKFVNFNVFKHLDISDVKKRTSKEYIISTTEQNLNYIAKQDFVKSISLDYVNKGLYDELIFPSSPFIHNNIDNVNQVIVPKKGDTLELTRLNMPYYYQIVTNYENNDIRIKKKKIFINDKQTNKYVVKNNYYYIITDNWHNGFDSRYFGFIPENCLKGKVILVIASLDKSTEWYKAIRFDRFFKTID